jgi:mono/diheme cytochrome c family protein
MIQRNNSKWMVLLVAVFGVAACGGDAAEASNEAVAQSAPEEAVVEAPADEAPMEETADMQELPEGVTMAMIEEGKTLFGGAGICMSCHGAEGQGVPNLGANLTDDEWVHSDGGYEGIVATVMNGVTADASSSGVPMPAKGGTSITDDQVRAVSAYVWTLSK